MANNITDEQLLDEVLSSQIPEAQESLPDNEQTTELNPVAEHSSEVNQPVKMENPLEGQKLSYRPGDRSSFISDEEKENDSKISSERHITRNGENIFKNAEYREGWIPVDKNLMGTRAYFYPEDWQFRIRPATVEAIRNWSTIDETNPFAVNDILNEVLKSCLSIVTSQGQIPWGNVNTWDRLYFLLLIREYTFITGEHKLKYDEDCPECDNPVTFELTSSSMLYEYPDEEIINYYDVNNRCWVIDPNEYDLEGEIMKLYLPTLEKDSNIKNWYVDIMQNNPNKKIESKFIKFLPWLLPKISKDLDVAKQQIKSAEAKYKALDTEHFCFLDDVIRNIEVVPKNKIMTKCEVCGEEVWAAVRFPTRINDLFDVPNKYRKFGNK